MLGLLLLALLSSAIAGPLWPKVCASSTAKKFDFCDPKLPIEERVKDYVARVPLEQKAVMMRNRASKYDALQIPPYQFGSEGLHGPLANCVSDGNTTKCPTSFPCPSAMGSAFNTTLYYMVGAADGREA